MTGRLTQRAILLGLLASLVSSATLVSASAGALPAYRVMWDGKGTTDGALNAAVCAEDNAPYLEFVLAGTSMSNARISFDNGTTSAAMTKVKTGANSSAFKYRYSPGASINLTNLLGNVVGLYNGTSRPSFAIGTGCLGSATPTDLAGFWNFDDSARIGHPAIGGIELVARGDATYTALGARGGGLYLDGSGDYLSPDTLFTDLPLGNSSYTIAAWIKPDELRGGNFNGIVGWGTYGSSLTVNAVRLAGSALLNYWWGYDLDGGTVITGSFQHVCATYDGTTRALYIDGVLVTSQTTAYANNATASNFAIGFTAPAYSEYFHGTIDDVAIYKRALSSAEISTLKTSGP